MCGNKHLYLLTYLYKNNHSQVTNMYKRGWLLHSLLEKEVLDLRDSPVAQHSTITVIIAGDSTCTGGVSPIIPITEKSNVRIYAWLRHYNLNLNRSLKNQPTLLSKAKYIWGILPIIVNSRKENKVCMDISIRNTWTPKIIDFGHLTTVRIWVLFCWWE